VSSWIGTGKKLLDVGCYDGTYSKLFLDSGNDVYGLEASRMAVREAKKKGIKATVADLETTFPYKNQYFDTIHAGEVIEHLYNTDIFIKECKRVLKPSGRLIITTPNTLSLPRRIVYLFGKGNFLDPSNSVSLEGRAVGHIRYFTFETLIKFLAYHGMVLTKYTSDFVNFPFCKSNSLATMIPTFGRSIIVEFKKYEV
jgi:2-polyprenyl-3-methyl-5-hydroxy-6-metoxy-1,4-benzoquinol methylase